MLKYMHVVHVTKYWGNGRNKAEIQVLMEMVKKHMQEILIMVRIQDSSVSTVAGYGLDDQRIGV
jgi:hypothetical protein